ncbi:MAG: bifunctional DNA-binding transcriptional regulator/O6-methylguanine-DNA methyltransferase Ada [Acidobacteriaceae bacterium]|nr:bifunctional DNA-binding transcriptional regulator/O6-methylguanine-DNA methyltransferase Ada [Acidobacteriaceae bacterium]
MKAEALDVEKCWNAVLAKDKAQDGCFVFGVKTTGVYCRPSCPARAPLRKNVRFYGTRAEAERDGLRACLRCRPAEVTGAESDKLRIRRLCDYIRRNCQSGESLDLEELAREVNLSPFHLQRTFRAAVGVTPKKYVESCRIEALKQQLRTRDSVTTAIYEAGFNSTSRVYERVDTRLGMTPSQYRAGGKGVTISYVCMETALGCMMAGATDRGLCFLQFGESAGALLSTLQKEYPAATLEPMKTPYPEQFDLWMKSLSRYLRREQIHLDIPVDVRATAFQVKVWRYLQSIPSGELQSYSEIATAIGHPRASRAVARACASNPVAIVIPCHRVIRGNGELGGYRWGMERKRVLIDNERAARSV